MRKLSLAGIRRGRRCKTTLPADLADHPLDRVNRQFVAARPNQLWVADITYVRTRSGFVYVAFVVDVFLTFYRGLACSEINADSVGSGCAGTSAVGPGKATRGHTSQ